MYFSLDPKISERKQLKKIGLKSENGHWLLKRIILSRFLYSKNSFLPSNADKLGKSSDVECLKLLLMIHS